MARKNGRDRGLVERPRGSGVWWVRTFTGGRERMVKVGAKSAARVYYQRVKAREREGQLGLTPPRRVPFSVLADDRSTYARARLKRPIDDVARVRRWKALYGHLDVTAITPAMIERELDAMAEQGYEPGTILRYVATLNAILNRAVRDGVLTVNPLRRVKLPKANNVLVRYLTAEQEAKLLEHLPSRYRALVTTALHTGLRQGELLRLTWADVDDHAGVLTVQEPKSGERRRLPMNSVVQRTLAGLRPTAPPPTERIFPHDARYLRRAFAQAVTDAGLAPFRFHDLRHTFASRLAMNGANDRTIMALGGWSSPRMLSRYAHLSPTHLWAAIEGLAGNPQDGTGTKTGTNGKGLCGQPAQPLDLSGAGNGI